MRVDEAAVRAPGKAAAAVAGDHGAAQGRGEGAALPFHIQRGAVRTAQDRDDPGIAQQAAGRLRGDSDLLFLPHERGGIDVDQDFDGRAIRMVGLGHGEEPIDTGVRGGVAGLEEPRRLVGRELDFDADHAVVGVPHMDVTRRWVGRIARLDAPVQAAHSLQLRGRAVAGELEEIGLVFRGGDARHRPYFGEADFAASQRLVDERQSGERVGDPQLFSGRAEGDAAPPAQPVRAGESALSGPPGVFVEPPQIGKQPVCRNVKKGGGLGDPIGEGIDVDGRSDGVHARL